jgi:hypothetical protein
MYSGDSGLGLARLDDPINTQKTVLAGILIRASTETGYGAHIISAEEILRFMTKYADQINAAVRK